METKIVYGIKFQIQNVGSEFEIYDTLSEADRFWNNDWNETIYPMRMVQISANSNELFINDCGKLSYTDKALDFGSVKTIKYNV